MIILAVTWLIWNSFPVASGQILAGQWSLKIGFRKQLLVDDTIIAERRNVTRQLGQVSKANEGKPIFTNGNPFTVLTVLHHEDRFKMWYIQRVDHSPEKERAPGYEAGMKLAYAESVDGLDWTKKADIQWPPDGYGKGIIEDYSQCPVVFIDPHENDPKHMYKAAYSSAESTAALAYSSNGLHWTPYNNGKAVTYRAGDYTNQLLWDEHARVYRLFTRTDFGAAGGKAFEKNPEIRGTRGMINRDLKADPTNWTTVRSWMFDREGSEEYKRRQLYTMTDWIYEGVHFGLMGVYEWPNDLSEGSYDTRKRHERDVTNFYIATSRDADHWDLSWVYAGKPILPRGPDGSFDKDCTYPPSILLTHQDKHWLYYGGGRERHDAARLDDYALGLATLRLDGFVTFEARDEPGTLTTKPFRLEGSQLEVNVDARNGEMSVEVLDPVQTGTPIAGFTQGEARVFKAVDELRLRPQWKGHADLTALKGKIVRLRFHLRNAKLYAFQIKP